MNKEEVRAKVEVLKTAYTFSKKFKKTSHFKQVKCWEKEDKFRVYVPGSSYEDAGYVSLTPDVYGRNSGEHRGMYYQASKPGNTGVLRGFIDALLGGGEKYE